MPSGRVGHRGAVRRYPRFEENTFRWPNERRASISNLVWLAQGSCSCSRSRLPAVLLSVGRNSRKPYFGRLCCCPAFPRRSSLAWYSDRVLWQWSYSFSAAKPEVQISSGRAARLFPETASLVGDPLVTIHASSASTRISASCRNLQWPITTAPTGPKLMQYRTMGDQRQA